MEEILHDEVTASALLDRLLRRRIVNIRGNSYRVRRDAELSKAIHPLANRIDPASIASRDRPAPARGAFRIWWRGLGQPDRGLGCCSAMPERSTRAGGCRTGDAPIAHGR